MWTSERDAELKRLWPVATASDIAKKMGTTKNAVIGRFHRLEGMYSDYESPSEIKRRADAESRRQMILEKEQPVISRLIEQIRRGGDRNRAIYAARRAGARLHAIADALGVSRQRVKQIVDGATDNKSIAAKAESR